MANPVNALSLRLPHLYTALLTCTLLLSLHDPTHAREISDPFGIIGFDCSRISELGIDRQMNLRAAAILQYCETGTTEWTAPGQSLVETAYHRVDLPLFGGTDINLITGGEIHPKVTQAESSAWGHGNTIVVAMDDSRGTTASPSSYCSVSVSTDGGTTFTRQPYLFNATGGCFGDPSVFYSVRAGKWFAGFFAVRCSSSGFGQWESPDGINWSESGCYFGSSSLDWLTSWVDNNPSSPFYGRQYAAFNNFGLAGVIQIVYSTDDGVTWSLPVTVSTASTTHRRSVEVFGSLGSDGTVFVQALEENGGFANVRQNFIYRSTTGGATWSPAIPQGGTFAPPGRGFSAYAPGMYTTPVATYWRYLGYGQPGAGPGAE